MLAITVALDAPAVGEDMTGERLTAALAFNLSGTIGFCMEIRDAVEADAEQLAALTETPADVMRNLIHDRTVRVAENDDLRGFVSYDAHADTVHITQLEGTPDLGERLLAEPMRFAEREGMAAELLVPVDDEACEAAERADFDEYGSGPQFDGTPTTRYRWEPES